MERRDDDPGLQFVLDNRKLILGFCLLMLLCGGFFVLGFVEGKRQGMLASSETKPAVGPEYGPKAPEGRSPSAAAPPGLEWYGKVGPAQEPSRARGKPAPPMPKPATPAPAADLGKPASPGGKVVYTVQVGAFRQRKEAETKAATLKSKGYEPIIDPPENADALYLLKVGRFESRADAVSVQSRLRRDGFTTFIKTN